MRTNTQNKTKNSGFSLIELIVVIAIMSILVGVAVVAVSGYVESAREAADRQTIVDVENALLLGASSGTYEPNTLVGFVAIGKTGATFSTNESVTAAGLATIDDIMTNAFGDNWESELKIQSNAFSGSDQAKILEAIRKAQQNGSTIFEDVPGSSYYAVEGGGSDQLVADVDELAIALKDALEGLGTDKETLLWGAFEDNVPDGLNYKGQGNKQTSANLTVFAVANSITNSKKKQEYIDAWVNQTPIDINKSEGTLCEPLAMNFAQCTAIKNYALTLPDEQLGELDKAMVEDAYRTLMIDMDALQRPSQLGYVGDFKAAIDAFLNDTFVAKVRDLWAKSGQAAKDANAFFASMEAVNTLEDNYVSVDRADELNKEKFYTDNGAADVLDNMVQYSQMGTIPDGDSEYVITLLIDKDGNPYVAPKLERN